MSAAWVFGISFTVASLVAGASLGHDADGGWSYPMACCKGTMIGGDCQVVPSNRVARSKRGFSVTINPGDHPLATRSHEFFIPYGNEMPSGNKHYHICLHPTEDDVNCFFAPPDGV